MSAPRILGAALLARLWTGCKVDKAVETVTIEDNLSSLLIKADGSVTLLPSEDGTVKIEATLYGKHTDFSYEVDDGEITLKKKCRFLHTGKCYVDFEVTAPPDIPTTIESGDGDVSIEGWEAPLEVDAGSGAISMENITVDVIIDASSGAVDGNHLAADIVEIST